MSNKAEAEAAFAATVVSIWLAAAASGAVLGFVLSAWFFVLPAICVLAVVWGAAFNSYVEWDRKGRK